METLTRSISTRSGSLGSSSMKEWQSMLEGMPNNVHPVQLHQESGMIKFDSLPEAIEAAKPGETIRIAGEHQPKFGLIKDAKLFIRKSIILEGVGDTKPIIKWRLVLEGPENQTIVRNIHFKDYGGLVGMEIKGGNQFIYGCTFEGIHCIEVSGGHCEINKCQLACSNRDEGVRLGWGIITNSPKATLNIKASRIFRFRTGIIHKGGESHIVDNKILCLDTGIIVEQADGTTCDIRHNEICGSTFGIHVVKEATVISNIFKDIKKLPIRNDMVHAHPNQKRNRHNKAYIELICYQCSTPIRSLLARNFKCSSCYRTYCRPCHKDNQKNDISDKFTSKKCITCYNEDNFGIKWESKISAGAFGEVWKCTWRDQWYAVKKTKKDDPKFVEFAKKEAKLMRRFIHPCLMQVVWGVATKSTALIVMPLYSRSLRNLIQIRKAKQMPFQLEEIIAVMKKICSGMVYLHGSDVAHRDLKSDNILVMEENSRVTEVCITDFGASKESDSSFAATLIGTKKFMPPELYVLGESQSEIHYDAKQSDMWSLGCVLCEMINLNLPHGEVEEKEAIIRSRNGVRPALLVEDYENSISLKNLVTIYEKCTSHNPAVRPRIQDVAMAFDHLDECGLFVQKSVEEGVIDDNNAKEQIEVLSLEAEQALKSGDFIKVRDLMAKMQFLQRAGTF
eukprot:TRINITY_DN636_c0_g1_i1.p1 TRINITY_DN636_c0_g1~~TRINITY_DN636_c0_g1_i1.p1  ORF type:complete len:677 (+),score=206.05 TRINITY_DN636_c0_g1_i1:159-2189(+)